MRALVSTGAALAVVIILLLYVIYVWREASYQCSAVLEGLWRGEKEFCHEAGIGGMLVYIGPVIDHGVSETRAIYLIMHSNNRIQVTTRLIATISGTVGPIPRRVYQLKLELADDPDDPDSMSIENIMPTCMNLEINPAAGTMLWYDQDDRDDDEPIIHGKFNKDNVSV